VTTPTRRDVEAAATRIDGAVRHTPLVASAWLSEATGADVRLKLESLQVTHSFKARGALSAILAHARARPGVPVVTASAGNHGVALAWAAKAAGVAATIFTPSGAPTTKLRAIARHGASLRAVARDYDDAERLALEQAGNDRAVYVSPYNHPEVIAGAGTIGLEITQEWPEVDTVVVPVGGGGLISGIAVALARARPRLRIVGVEAENNPVFTRCLAAGRITPVDVAPTIADGLSGNLEAGSVTFEIVRDAVDEVVTVSEADLRAAMRDLVAHDHLVAEGAGVPAVAALRASRLRVGGKRVAAIVSGSNVDVATLIDVLTGVDRQP
jgi:threonine dehydratase